MKIKVAVYAIVTLLHGLSTHAADIEAGKAKSATCIACHGNEGISPNPQWPNLAGQKDLYLKNQIIAFRDGKRQSVIMMAPMVANLSDDDAANLAAYYASLGQ